MEQCQLHIGEYNCLNNLHIDIILLGIYIITSYTKDARSVHLTTFHGKNHSISSIYKERTNQKVFLTMN